MDMFTQLPCSASFSRQKTRSYLGRIQRCCICALDTDSAHYMQHSNKQKNKYDPKIEMVEYSELLDQNKI